MAVAGLEIQARQSGSSLPWRCRTRWCSRRCGIELGNLDDDGITLTLALHHLFYLISSCCASSAGWAGWAGRALVALLAAAQLHVPADGCKGCVDLHAGNCYHASRTGQPEDKCSKEGNETECGENDGGVWCLGPGPSPPTAASQCCQHSNHVGHCHNHCNTTASKAECAWLGLYEGPRSGPYSVSCA